MVNSQETRQFTLRDKWQFRVPPRLELLVLWASCSKDPPQYSHTLRNHFVKAAIWILSKARIIHLYSFLFSFRVISDPKNLLSTTWSENCRRVKEPKLYPRRLSNIFKSEKRAENKTAKNSHHVPRCQRSVLLDYSSTEQVQPKTGQIT